MRARSDLVLLVCSELAAGGFILAGSPARLASAAEVKPSARLASGAAGLGLGVGTEVVENADGSKTARLGVAGKGKRTEGGGLEDFDVKVAKKGGRWVPRLVGDEVSFASVSDDRSGLVSVGRLGRRVVFGSPSAKAFSDDVVVAGAKKQGAVTRGVGGCELHP
jgi:hypothetical protein